MTRDPDHARTDLPAVGTPQPSTLCVTCTTEGATVCRECVRATALMSFGGIARHPEQGTTCRLCEAGAPAHCGRCFVTETVTYRELLRTQGAHRDIRVGHDVQ